MRYIGLSFCSVLVFAPLSRYENKPIESLAPHGIRFEVKESSPEFAGVTLKIIAPKEGEVLDHEQVFAQLEVAQFQLGIQTKT